MHDVTRPAQAPSVPPTGSAWRIPAWVWGAAIFAALVHMAPYWRADSQAPAGWTFTANLSSSPDYMQYRVWMRQTQTEGVLVNNVFTSAPNRPYLPVSVYWAIGAVASVTGMSPEWAYAYVGAIVAIAFTLMVWVAIRRFNPPSTAAAWAFAIVMLGGGLGGYITLMEGYWRTRDNPLIQAFLLTPFGPEGDALLAERFRGNYVIQALFDTHFLIFWLVTTGAVLALHSALRSYSTKRVAVTAAIFGVGTFLHIYEGVTLLAIAAAVVGLCSMRGLVTRRQAITTLASCSGAVAVVLLPLGFIAARAGLPAPSWRGENILFSVVVMSYPLAFAMLAYGFGRFWREADLDRVFLVGWALGGLTLLLAGPLFPYPDRGTMTLSIPLATIATMIWFTSHARVRFTHACVILLLLGSTPLWVVWSLDRRTTFKAVETHKWTNGDHAQFIALLANRAGREDVLVADEVSLRWLAPEYRGVHHAGHFFLTPDFTAKQAELQRFHDSATAPERAAMIANWRARWIFVAPGGDLSKFTTLPRVQVAMQNAAGALLEILPPRATP